VHCIVPSGGLSADGQRWIACRKSFFLPVRVLSRLYSGLVLWRGRPALDVMRRRPGERTFRASE
jgi:hypothetical protein